MDGMMPEEILERARGSYRIEALRAASRVAHAGVCGVERTDTQYTLNIAEQFARWLESGER